MKLTKWKPWSLEEEYTAQILYNSGRTCPEIANYLGTSIDPVSRKIRLIRNDYPESVIGWKKHRSLYTKRAWANGIYANRKHARLYGDKHPMWRGDKVQRVALHNWIRRRKPKPALCEICGLVEPFDLANISGTYKRDITDFQWLCRKCHMVVDGRLENLYRAVLKRVGRLPKLMLQTKLNDFEQKGVELSG